jgi:cell division protein ZapA (FtsZ GTPase activity inhibitor)
MREIDQTTQAKSSLKVAILAALNITDELFQQREAHKSLLNSLEGKLSSLANNLDHSLKDDTQSD